MKEELRRKEIEVRFLKNSTNQSGGDRESTRDFLARLQHKIKIWIYESIQTTSNDERVTRSISWHIQGILL